MMSVKTTNAMVCSACSSASTLLSRCGHCKWVTYCSRECQMRHWKTGGHRTLCTTLRTVAAFRDAENLFWQSRSPAELASFTAEEGLDPSSMRFFGEVLFFLRGLKPCVLFSNLPHSWLAVFVRDVVTASGLFKAQPNQECKPALYIAKENVQTPAEYTLANTLVLVNSTHPACSTVVDDLQLEPVESGATQSPTSPSSIITEGYLARLLDYPVALDECAGDIMEVGYFQVLPNGSKLLLSSYCAGVNPLHEQRIRAHFRRYHAHFDQERRFPFVTRTCMFPKRLDRSRRREDYVWATVDVRRTATSHRIGRPQHLCTQHTHKHFHQTNEGERDSSIMSSGGGGYNDWETDLSSIIEKTNQNLKLLRCIGDKRSDASSYDISMTAPLPASSSRPATSAAQMASDMRSFASSISSRYAAEDAASRSHHRASTTGIPRASSSVGGSSSTRKMHRSSSVGVESRERARESLIIRPSINAFGLASDMEGDGESATKSPRVRPAAGTRITSATKARSSMSSAKTKPTARTSATGTTVSASSPPAFMGGDGDHSNAFEELRKSLEVHIASRSGAFEKALADLRTDMTVATTETSGLNLKIHDLKDAVMTKLNAVAAASQSIAEQNESIGRLEKHSAVLLGWKVGVDQDLFELTAKLKGFATIQDKMSSLEGHMESLGTAIKTAQRASRHDEKIDELKDRMAMLERQLAHQMDARAIEHTVQMRVAKEINELENRMNQSLAFLTQKLENKLQSLEKTVQSDRIDATASLKSELVEDMDRMDTKTAKKQDLVPILNAQTQIKEDIAHMQLFFERQDKRFQEMKQNSAQIKEELVETRHELTKALHAQQNRVSTTLEEKVAHMIVASKDKNVKVEQKIALLEKRAKKAEDLGKALQDAMAKMKKEMMSHQAADTVSQQRENEKLRQRLARFIAELEQVQAAKHDVEKAFEAQERQYQAKLKDLKTKLDDHEKTKEAERAELMQAIQNEAKHMGYAQGRQALLESLLAKEKAESEDKSQQVHKCRQEVALIRQKMRGLEADVDKKLLKLSADLQSKQSQVEALTKKLKRSEEDAAKAADAAQREKKLLLRTKELKQQELHVTKLKLKELEKVAAGTRSLSVTPSEQHREEDKATQAVRTEEIDAKRKELEALLLERQIELQSLKSELASMAAERVSLMKEHGESLMNKTSQVREEFEVKIHGLERCVRMKDTQMQQLLESMIDKSELDELAEMLEVVRQEKEALVEQLRTEEVVQSQRMVEMQSSIEQLHRKEMERLQSTLKERVEELAAVVQTLKESRSRIEELQSVAREQDSVHRLDIARLGDDLKGVCADKEDLTMRISELESEKREVEATLRGTQAKMEASVQDDARDEELEELRANVEELNGERQRLHAELTERSVELTELSRQEQVQREQIADLLKDQDETQARFDDELATLRETLQSVREASATRLLELQTAIDVLRVELDVVKKQNEDATSAKSSLESTVSDLLAKLAVASQAESDMRTRLDAVINAVAELGHVSTNECAQDPAAAIKRSVNMIAHQASSELEALRVEYDLAVHQAATQRDRVKDLERQTSELEELVKSEEAACSELKSDLAQVCAEKAAALLLIGRLEEETSSLQGAKHALEVEVEESIAKVEDLEATTASQLEEIEVEVRELQEANGALEQAVADVQASMAEIEARKIDDLEHLTIDLNSLEVQLSALTEKRGRGDAGDGNREKEYYTNQQAIATLAQSIRSMYTKLTSGCSISEWHEMKMALEALEQKHERQVQLLERDRRVCSQTEDEVLLNIEFLEALTRSGGDDMKDSLAARYVRLAPELLNKLKLLQAKFDDAVQECAVSAIASLTEAPPNSEYDDKEGGNEEHESPEEPGEENDEDVVEDEEDDLPDNASDASQVDELEMSTEFDELEASASQLEESNGEIGEGSHQVEADKKDESPMSNRDILKHHPMMQSGTGEADHGENKFERVTLTMDISAVTSRSEASRIEACTTLLHSPTAVLLQERFSSRRNDVEGSDPDVTSDNDAEAATDAHVVLAGVLVTSATDRLRPQLDDTAHTEDGDEEEDAETSPPPSPSREFAVGDMVVGQSVDDETTAAMGSTAVNTPNVLDQKMGMGDKVAPAPSPLRDATMPPEHTDDMASSSDSENGEQDDDDSSSASRKALADALIDDELEGEESSGELQQEEHQDATHTSDLPSSNGYDSRAEDQEDDAIDRSDDEEDDGVDDVNAETETDLGPVPPSEGHVFDDEDGAVSPEQSPKHRGDMRRRNHDDDEDPEVDGDVFIDSSDDDGEHEQGEVQDMDGDDEEMQGESLSQSLEDVVQMAAGDEATRGDGVPDHQSEAGDVGGMSTISNDERAFGSSIQQPSEDRDDVDLCEPSADESGKVQSMLKISTRPNDRDGDADGEDLIDADSDMSDDELGQSADVNEHEEIAKSPAESAHVMAPANVVPKLSLMRLTAMQGEFDEEDDDALASQISMDSRRRAMSDNDDEFDDLEESHDETAATSMTKGESADQELDSSLDVKAVGDVPELEHEAHDDDGEVSDGESKDMDADERTSDEDMALAARGASEEQATTSSQSRFVCDDDEDVDEDAESDIDQSHDASMEIQSGSDDAHIESTPQVTLQTPSPSLDVEILHQGTTSERRCSDTHEDQVATALTAGVGHDAGDDIDHREAMEDERAHFDDEAVSDDDDDDDAIDDGSIDGSDEIDRSEDYDRIDHTEAAAPTTEDREDESERSAREPAIDKHSSPVGDLRGSPSDGDDAEASEVDPGPMDESADSVDLERVREDAADHAHITRTDVESPHPIGVSESALAVSHRDGLHHDTEHSDRDDNIDSDEEIDQDDGQELSEMDGSDDFDNVQLQWGESTGVASPVKAMSAVPIQVRPDFESSFDREDLTQAEKQDGDAAARESQSQEFSNDTPRSCADSFDDSERPSPMNGEGAAKASEDARAGGSQDDADQSSKHSDHDEALSEVDESNDFDSVRIPWEESTDVDHAATMTASESVANVEEDEEEEVIQTRVDSPHGGGDDERGFSTDHQGEEGDADDLDEMDEIEKLVRMHEEKANTDSTDAPGEFASSLRMEDDDDDSGAALDDQGDGDELIDSDSDDGEDESQDDLSPTKLALSGSEVAKTYGDGSEASSSSSEEESSTVRLPVPSFGAAESVAKPDAVASTFAAPQSLRTVADGSDDESDDDEKASPAPAPQSYQLPLASGPGARNRGAGAGSLMKALQASRDATRDDIDDDDDVGEVEKLMQAHSFQKKTPAVNGQNVQLVMLKKAHSDAGSDDDVEHSDHEVAKGDVQPAIAANASPVIFPEERVETGSDEEKDNANGDIDGDESFADDDLDRVVASPQKTTLPFKATKSFDSDDDEDGEDNTEKPRQNLSPLSSSATGFIMGQRRPGGGGGGGLNPHPALSKKPGLGLANIGRHTFTNDDDDDDMGEIERLLLEKTSMKGPQSKPQAAATLPSSRQPSRMVDDDEFDLPLQVAADAAVSPTPDRSVLVPPALDDDDEFAHFDREDVEDQDQEQQDEEEDHDDDTQLARSVDTRPSLSKATRQAGSPLRKPNLVPRKLSEQSDNGSDAYLSESFDLEESLQEEDDEDSSTG